MVKIHKCGTLVTTKLGSIDAMITASCIRFDKTQYEVSYFIGGDRKEVWLNEDEFTTEAKKQNIGYK